MFNTRSNARGSLKNMLLLQTKKYYSFREIFRKNRQSLVIFAKMWNEKGISVLTLDRINSSIKFSSNHLQKL
jgi:hypothetical protein